MKTHTLTFAEDRLNVLSGLIVAAGKSPATPADAMLAAAEMLTWLQQQCAPKQDASNIIELPAKDAAHG